MTVKNKKNMKYSGKNTSKKKNVNDLIVKEIISIAAIAFSVLMILSVFSKSNSGALGYFIGNFLKGILGVGAFVLPFLIIALSVYIIFDKKKEIATYKIAMGIGLFLIYISFTHILQVDETSTYAGALDYIKSNYTSGSINNGGLFGALLGNCILSIFGRIFSYVLLIALSIIFIIVITGKSFFEGVSKSFETVRDKIADAYYEEEEYYEEEKKPTRYKKKREVDFIIDEDKRTKKEVKILLPGDKSEDGGKAAVKTDFEPVEEPVIDSKIITFDIEEKSEESMDKFLEHEESEEEEIPVITIRETIPKKMPEKPKEDHSAMDIKSTSDGENKEYVFPPISLLQENMETGRESSKQMILENSKKLEETLKSFGVEAKVIEVSKGPTVTRYELSPGQGVKVSRISSLADDLALNLAANGIRIEAPIPGKAAVGIEVPNKETQTVFFREIIEDEAFQKFPSKLAFGLGKDIAGKAVVADIAKMPHLLIAGATGSGKSVCINTLIASILYKSSPEEVKLIMVDPKVVELSIYNGIPHLLIPVVTDPKKAAGALNWAVREMLRRYDLFAQNAVRDLKGYNKLAEENDEIQMEPQIIIIIDELADLMMAAPGEVEDSICRLAQMARAAGLHLIIATQRPSVDVITGVIKANIPSRLAFSVSSGTDSRTILDMVGAEKLLGRGDMLFYPVGKNKPVRIQGAFISDKEVESIVEFLKEMSDHQYDQKMIDNITSSSKTLEINDEADEFFEQAVEFVILKEKASASMLQRQFRIGYNRAARLIEDLELKGIVGPEDGSKPRKVLITYSQWNEMKNGPYETEEEPV
jgi:S-DNA-T family DNA segregation ATPase FtsK/SpoIIIE